MLAAQFSFSQTKKVIKYSDLTPNGEIKKPKTPRKTHFGLGGGLTRSVIFLSRNVWEYNDANGLYLNFIYGGNKLLRFTGEYIQYSKIDIKPTWYNIQAKSYEANIHFLAKFKNNNDLIYPITGFSLNEFKGFFTGREDFQNLREKYEINTDVKNYWIGMNFGIGYEHAFGPIKAVAMYKMRVGAQDYNEKLNIMDVCYTFALRYDFKVLTPKNLIRSIFNPVRGRYDLD